MANSPSSSSSPSLKKKKESELEESSEVGKPLFILCQRDGGVFLHEIIIGEDVHVKGKPFADLPLITKMFDGDKDVSWMDSTCTNLGSKLYLTAASLTNKKIFKTQLFDAKDRSLRSGAFNATPLKEKSSRPLARKPNYTLIGACGKIYALVLPRVLIGFARSGCFDPILFECFDPIAGTWESLSPPLTSLDTLTGYVVIEEHHLILVSFVSTYYYDVEFYSFNLLTLEWNRVLIMEPKDKRKIASVTYDIYHPHFIYTGKLHNLEAYPIYGKAEFVNGIIYGCVLRTIATYRFSLDTVTGQASLEASVLHHQACYNSNLINFEDAPAYKDAPYGLPSFYLMEITHLGNNIFCVVETAAENHYESFSFQPVYITTFYLNVTPDFKDFEFIELIDSTVRLVDVRKLRGPTAAVMLCFSPLDNPLGYNQYHAGPSTDSLCKNFKEYVHSRIPTLCKVFMNHMSKMHPYARMLFSKMKHEIEKSEDPVVRYFFQCMVWILDRGPQPDPLLLVADKKLDKGLMVHSPRPFDLVESLDCNKSIFIVSSVRGGYMYGLHELRILKGAVDGNFIPLKIEVKQYNRGERFESVNLGSDVYFFSVKRLDGKVAALVNFSVVNVEKNSRLEKLTKSAPMNNDLMAFGNALKIYALSSPSESSDFIPTTAFVCFDPASGLWEPLKPAPFHSVSMVAELSGYAMVDDFVVISVSSDKFEYYSYNFHRNEWLRVLKPENMESERYQAFHGKSVYVDGKIYTYSCNGVVLEFSLKEYQYGFLIYPPVELKRLDLASPLVDWDREFSEFLIHLGGKVFCAIDTGESSQSDTCKFARVTTFTILNSGDVQTWHSTICVLDAGILDWDWSYIFQCFSL